MARKDDRTKIWDKRQCNKIWAARNPEGIWFVYGTWGTGRLSTTRTLGYRRTKEAANNLVKEMKKRYL